ncbi:MAG: AAA family ATPase [Candidatus Moraniibacteriota bacterium]
MHKKSLLIIISGLPAAGKTTLAEKISKKFNIPVVSCDQIKELIFDRVGRWDDTDIFDGVSNASYDLIYRIAENIMQVGGACILEAFFLSQLADLRISNIQKKYNCEVLQIYLESDIETLESRYKERFLSGERHSCHSPIAEISDVREKAILNIAGETMIIDTTHIGAKKFNKVFEKISNYIN